MAALAAACSPTEDVPREAVRISHDPFTDTEGQHATAVEPDVAVDGETVIAAFQVGRRRTGGATAIGWSTSRDGGRTWDGGILPLTAGSSPPGPASYASDPVVAYDAAHRTWLVAALAVRRAPGRPSTSLLVSRSPDGERWSAPVVADPESPRGLEHDKPWVECDDEGRCYLVWSGRGGLAIATSDDGGRTWTRETGRSDLPGVGYLPVPRPDGSVVVVYEVPQRAVFAHVTTDGGRSFAPAQFVAPVNERLSPARNIRGFPLPTASATADGRVVVAWHDCAQRGCTSNDLYVSTSADGATWSPPRRVRTGITAPLNEFLPALAARDDDLALLYYATPERGRVAPYVVSSRDEGRTWSAPVRLAPPRALTSFPESERGVRFLGDYNAAAFVGDDVLAVFAWAEPRTGRYDQGIYAALVEVTS